MNSRQHRVLQFFAAAALLTFSRSAVGQPMAGKAQPDRLTLGVVRQGAILEASVRVFEDGDDADVPAKVTPPKFVTVKSTKIGTQMYGTFGTKVVYDVSIAVDCSAPGELSDVLQIEIGKQKIDVPVAATVLPPEPDLTRILIAETPFDKFSTNDAERFAPWLELVKGSKWDVHYLEVVEGDDVLRDLDLDRYDVVFLGETGLIHLTEKDESRVKRFLRDGGRLVVAANRFYVGTVPKANALIGPFGLKMTDDEPRGESRYLLKGESILPHRLTEGVASVHFFRPSPVETTEDGMGELLIGAPPYEGKGFAAFAPAGRGEVAALGVSLWWNWIAREEGKDSDNRRLLQNLLTRSQRAEAP